MPKLRKALYAVTVFTGCAMTSTFFLDTFWCGRQVSVNWSLDEGACNTFASKEVFRIDWATNVSTDVFSKWHVLLENQDTNKTTVFMIPFPLLHELQLNRRQIWGLVATFSLGIITITMSVVRFATIEVIHAWNNVCKLNVK
jgi:hypothetical protein